MANTETGHAKNVANFEDLISFCTGYGASYNPGNDSIKLPALTALHTEAANKMAVVNSTLTPWSNAVAAREILFEPLSKLITRVVNALESSGVPDQVVDNSKTSVPEFSKYSKPKVRSLSFTYPETKQIFLPFKSNGKTSISSFRDDSP